MYLLCGMKTFVVLFTVGGSGQKEADTIQNSKLVINYDEKKGGYTEVSSAKVIDKLDKILGEDNSIYSVYSLSEFMHIVNNQELDNFGNHFISYVHAEFDFKAREREILLANVLDYFSDLKEAQIEAMIPNLIKFISGRDPKNSVVINEDEDGTFSIYEESGQCIEFGFESKDEAEDYAVDNHMVVVDKFNL